MDGHPLPLPTAPESLLSWLYIWMAMVVVFYYALNWIVHRIK